MLSRDEFLRQALSLLEAIELASVRRQSGDIAPIPYVVVGPTPSELAEFAPRLAALVKTKEHSAVIPVHQGQTWKELILADGFASLAMIEVRKTGIGDGVMPVRLIAIPPDSHLDVSSLPRGDSLRQTLEGANPGLVFLATRLVGSYATFSVTTAESLTDSGSRLTRRFMGQLYAEQGSSYRSAPFEPAPTRHGRADPATERLELIEAWLQGQFEHRYFTSCQPGTIWQFTRPDAEAAEPTICAIGEPVGVDECVHCRSFERDWARRLLIDTSFLDEMLTVACGAGLRSEDDVFLPLTEFLDSDDWQILPRQLHGFGSAAARLGYPNAAPEESSRSITRHQTQKFGAICGGYLADPIGLYWRSGCSRIQSRHRCSRRTGSGS
jgi:hypothetical protein